MNDILPDEVQRWQRLEAAFRRRAELHGYAEVRTPIIEHTALFRRQVGETTDIVEKEMYSFERHGDDLTVRPEGTAGAARAYVEHQRAAKEPVSRWYYLGPMFRGERPQEGLPALAVEEGPRVGHEAQLVRHGHPYPRLAQIDRRHPGRLPLRHRHEPR